MAQIEFVYNGVNTIIQCNLNEKFKYIIQRFKDKVGLNNNKNLIFTYDGKVGINEELTFGEISNTEDKTRNKMNVLVYENEFEIRDKDIDIIKSKNVICPECKENIKMEIKDYKINLYDWKNGHKFEDIPLNEFEETQNIDRLKIICDICKKNNKSISFNNIFYKCLTCKNNICPLCKSNHDQSHKIINYDDKYYICEKHNENYISYCEECKMNLCLFCNEHKNHKWIMFTDILPNKEELNHIKEEFNKNIKLFIKEMEILKKLILTVLNEVKNKMNIYYQINEDIINNYNENNINYETIYYLNQFQNNNNNFIN